MIHLNEIFRIKSLEFEMYYSVESYTFSNYFLCMLINICYAEISMMLKSAYILNYEIYRSQILIGNIKT